MICWRSWSDLLEKLRLLALARRAPQLELPLFGRHHLGDVGILAAGDQVVRKGDLAAPSRSASRRAWRASISSRALVTMARLVRAWVSSSAPRHPLLHVVAVLTRRCRGAAGRDPGAHQLAIVTKALDEMEARQARLEAERDGAAKVTFRTT